jgi:cyclophilin family peptidyl-prolyl cis-trans isomerase
MAGPQVTFEVEQSGQPLGAITLELNEAEAPITVENFLQYVDEGYYNNTAFHRVIPTFMIQGGGHNADLSPKQAGQHPPIQNEAKNGLTNARGTIAMARTADPHSATSQFFINVNDNTMLDPPGQDGWGYCVFGKVVDGMDVVDKIKDVETEMNPQMREQSQPVDPPVITEAKRA